MEFSVWTLCAEQIAAIDAIVAEADAVLAEQGQI